MRKLLFLCLLMFGASSLLFAQSRQISGRVTDDTGAPLQGVSVQVKGTTNTTQTNKNGDFTIQVTGANAELTISYTGFTAQTVEATANMIVKLERSVSSLDDVVVVGYQTMKRKDLTASVSSVSARQLKDVPINSAAQALAGRLAGVQVTGTEGSPNAEVLIRVRGGGSITQDNSPLYIIDGVQVENGLSALSPQDIVSIDVLKDASATAIYGSRGANGVVIITTKGGKNTKPTISYNGFIGVGKIANKLKVLNPYDFVVYQYERSRGNATDSTNFVRQYGTTWDTLSNYKNVPFVDWQDEMFGRNAIMQTHNVALSGGNASTQYNLSLTSNKEDGLMLGSGFDRKLVSFKFDHKFDNKLRVGFNTRYNNTITTGAGTSTTGSAGTNRLRQSVRYRPMLLQGQNIYDFDPDYFNETNANGMNMVNPVLLNDAEYRKNFNNILNLSGYVEYKLTPYLSFKSTGGIDFNNGKQQFFDDTLTSNSRQNGSVQPMAGITNTQRTTINNSNVFTFDATKTKIGFFKRHNLNMLAGHELYQSNYKTQVQLMRYFPVGISPKTALANFNLGTAYTDPSRPATSEVEERMVSFFGRVNYSFDSRYLVTASLRADGSSKFGTGNKWGYFPSGSVAWRLSNEKFFESLKSTVNDLKLRVSYGEAGNNRIPNFGYLTQYAASTQYWLNEQLVTAYAPAALAYPNLVWETTVSRNLGLDLSILNNRIQFTADVYRNTTKDLLINVPVPTSSGYTTQIQNVGSTENRGVEFQVNAAVLEKKNFSWNANFNISFNKNKVLSLGDRQSFFLTNSGWGFSNTPADYIVRVGDPVGAMWGFVTDGYYTIDQFDYNPATQTYTLKPGVASNGSITATPQPGLVRFRDIAGPIDPATGKPGPPDGKIDDNDKQIIGVAQPKFFGGLNQQFTWKNFDLNIFLNFSVGGEIYNANKLEFTSGYTANANMLDMVNNRWTRINSQGQVVTDPVALAALNANATMWSPSTSSTSFVLHSWAIEDGSFLRINNVSLGYTFASSLLRKMKMQRARVYVTGTNLAVFTKYTGYDPEVSTRRGNPVTPGVDYSGYPRSRTFIFGLNLTF